MKCKQFLLNFWGSHPRRHLLFKALILSKWPVGRAVKGFATEKRVRCIRGKTKAFPLATQCAGMLQGYPEQVSKVQGRGRASRVGRELSGNGKMD